MCTKASSHQSSCVLHKASLCVCTYRPTRNTGLRSLPPLPFIYPVSIPALEAFHPALSSACHGDKQLHERSTSYQPESSVSREIVARCCTTIHALQLLPVTRLLASNAVWPPCGVGGATAPCYQSPTAGDTRQARIRMRHHIAKRVEGQRGTLDAIV